MVENSQPKPPALTSSSIDTGEESRPLVGFSFIFLRKNKYHLPKMNTFVTLTVLFAMVLVASANQVDSTKQDLAARHNDALAARVNLGTAISLVVPIALGLALVGFLAPLFQSFFSPIAFGPTLGYARKGKSLFSGINQESVMQVLDTVTKAIDAFSAIDGDKAQPKSQ